MKTKQERLKKAIEDRDALNALIEKLSNTVVNYDELDVGSLVLINKLSGKNVASFSSTKDVIDFSKPLTLLFKDEKFYIDKNCRKFCGTYKYTTFVQDGIFIAYTDLDSNEKGNYIDEVIEY